MILPLKEIKQGFKENASFPICFIKFDNDKVVILPIVKIQENLPTNTDMQSIMYVLGEVLKSSIEKDKIKIKEIQLSYDTYFVEVKSEKIPKNIKPSECKNRKEALVNVLINPYSGKTLEFEMIEYTRDKENITFKKIKNMKNLKEMSSGITNALYKGFNK